MTKTIKTFLAPWRPAGRLIRVVLVKEEDGGLAFFCLDARAPAVEVLEAMADRGAIAQTNKDVQEVWRAGQQPVRNLDSNVAAFNLNLWLYSLVEVSAWDKDEEEVADRGRCPRDSAPRRPSHADKRKALQREVLRGEISEALRGAPDKEQIRALAERLLALAA